MTEPRRDDESDAGRKQPVALRTIDGKYSLLREIGSGSAATVYEAEHLIVGKRVAIKVLHPLVARDESLVARFIGEARAVAQIGHENLVDVHDYGVWERSPYIVMELLEGENLEALIARRGAMPPAYACELMVQVLAGLAAAHQAGVVHRDLKPANIFITHPKPDRPLVKVLDFGIAKGVASSISGNHPEIGLIGTPLYMAPEQALASKDVDERADLYACGVILYEMLAGDPPYGGEMSEVLQKIIKGKFRPLATVNPAVPRLLTHAVAAAMKTDRDERMGTARELAMQLSPYLSNPPPHSIPDGPRSAHAFLLTAKDVGIRFASDGPGVSRPPRDFPSFHLAKVTGKPRGEPLSDAILQSPIIPRAPFAPHIQTFGPGRDLERWSNAPEMKEPSVLPPEPFEPAVAEAPQPTHRIPASFEPLPEPRPNAGLKRALVATAVGVGLGAALAWLSYLG